MHLPCRRQRRCDCRCRATVNLARRSEDVGCRWSESSSVRGGVLCLGRRMSPARDCHSPKGDKSPGAAGAVQSSVRVRVGGAVPWPEPDAVRRGGEHTARRRQHECGNHYLSSGSSSGQFSFPRSGVSLREVRFVRGHVVDQDGPRLAALDERTLHPYLVLRVVRKQVM